MSETEQDLMREARERTLAAAKSHGGAPAKSPCGSCPYRKDVPSGVWAPEEYEKLPLYDGPLITQPVGAFFCHQQDGRLCAGWVGCHDMDDSLGLRMAHSHGHISTEGAQAAVDYVSRVPLWESGQAARDHGMAEVDAPSPKAERIVQKLVKTVPGVILRGDR